MHSDITHIHAVLITVWRVIYELPNERDMRRENFTSIYSTAWSTREISIDSFHFTFYL